MEILKREIDLNLEVPSYPWQFVDGDGQTWVILRSKMQMPNESITELGDLLLEDISCQLLKSADGKVLYGGKLKLQAYYNSKSHYELNLPCPEAANDEHKAREQLSYIKECPLIKNEVAEETVATSAFLSKMYEELVVTTTADIAEMRKWQIELPWQAWIEGGELIEEPQIVFAHLGQVGMGTLLCEVLINLGAQDEERVGNQLSEGDCFLAGEEVVFNFSQDRIDKIAGSTLRRAFQKIKPGRNNTLNLEYLTKVSLVYISAEPGGERILAAWALVPGSLTLPMRSLPSLVPFIGRMKNEKITIVLTNEKRVLFKDQFVVTLGEGDQVKAIEPQKLIALEPKEKIEASVADSSQQNVAFVRPRPGDKWLKKSTVSTSSSSSQKKVLAIKFGTR